MNEDAQYAQALDPEYAQAVDLSAVPEQSAMDVFAQHLGWLSEITERLEKRLDPVLRGAHPTDTNPVGPDSSPLRNVASDLSNRLQRLAYIVDRIDL